MLDKLNLTTTILFFSPFSQYLLFPEQIKIKVQRSIKNNSVLVEILTLSQSSSCFFLSIYSTLGWAGVCVTGPFQAQNPCSTIHH